MEFTDSQKDFILNSLTTEITKQEKHIKYWTDKAEKENSIPLKNGMRRSVEYAVKKLNDNQIKHAEEYNKQTLKPKKKNDRTKKEGLN